jgi:hypothetical protein
VSIFSYQVPFALVSQSLVHFYEYLTERSCTLRGFEPVSRKRNGGKAARENYLETALNSSARKLSGDWVFGYSEFCCSSAFAALVNEVSEKHRKNCKLLNAVDRGQFALTH